MGDKFQAILCGTKCDTCGGTSVGEERVCRDDVEALAAELGHTVCRLCLETSAIEETGIDALMDNLSKIGIAHAYGVPFEPTNEARVAPPHGKALQVDGDGLTEMKVVVLGARNIGKTQLVRRLRGEPIDWSAPYEPTDFECHTVTLQRERGPPIEAEVWDTSGLQGSAVQTSQMIFPGAHVLVLGYDVGSELSLHNVTEEFRVQLVEAYGSVEAIPALLLVGMKLDLRDAKEQRGDT